MNKIILNGNDMMYLNEWENKYSDLVLESLKYCPMKAIKIYQIFSADIIKELFGKEKEETQIITCIRDDDILNLTVTHSKRNSSKLVFKLNYDAKTLEESAELIKLRFVLPNVRKFAEQEFEEFKTVIYHQYISIMALMLFGNEYDVSDKEKETEQETDTKPKKNKKKNKKKSKKSNSNGITYIIKRDSKGIPHIARQGERAKPNGQFQVRGHYRHHPSGKLVWVREYTKGKGKKPTDTTYKIKSK